MGEALSFPLEKFYTFEVIRDNYYYLLLTQIKADVSRTFHGHLK